MKVFLCLFTSQQLKLCWMCFMSSWLWVIYKTVWKLKSGLEPFSCRDSLSEVFPHCVLSSPKPSRVCGCWFGWWSSDQTLWQQHKESRTQTGLGVRRAWSTALGEGDSACFGCTAVVEKQPGQLKGTLQPNWRFVYISLSSNTNTQSHSHTKTYTNSLTHTHTYTQSHTHKHAHSHKRTHTITFTHTLTLSHRNNYTNVAFTSNTQSTKYWTSPRF